MIFVRRETAGKGAESLLGKKFVESVASYATLNSLVKEGHDVTKEITFVDGMADADKIQAILKEALDDAQKKWGSEDPSFYEEAQKFYTEHNTNQ